MLFTLVLWGRCPWKGMRGEWLPPWSSLWGSRGRGEMWRGRPSSQPHPRLYLLTKYERNDFRTEVNRSLGLTVWNVFPKKTPTCCRRTRLDETNLHHLENNNNRCWIRTWYSAANCWQPNLQQPPPWWKSYPNKRDEFLVGIFITSGKREQRVLWMNLVFWWCSLSGLCSHVLCLQVSMASAMGSWCVMVAPLMYWKILPATSSWSGNRRRKWMNASVFTVLVSRYSYFVGLVVPVCGGSERLNTSLHAPSRKEEL